VLFFDNQSEFTILTWFFSLLPQRTRKDPVQSKSLWQNVTQSKIKNNHTREMTRYCCTTHYPLVNYDFWSLIILSHDRFFWPVRIHAQLNFNYDRSVRTKCTRVQNVCNHALFFSTKTGANATGVLHPACESKAGSPHPQCRPHAKSGGLTIRLCHEFHSFTVFEQEMFENGEWEEYLHTIMYFKNTCTI
jgi:hypothetical protein